MVTEGKHPVINFRAVKRRLAFSLAGGGARGALQVGALRALLEAHVHPDLLVGTSVGAINAAFIAMHGYTATSLNELEQTWLKAAKADLLPANAAWLTVRVLFNRAHAYPYSRMRDFFIAQGLSPDLHFGELPGPAAILVASDLNSYRPVFYGADPQESLLEGVLASTALPPWVHPLELNGRFLMDGGVVSNLPIEPAIRHGATEIIALKLSAPPAGEVDAHGFGPFLNKLLATTEERQIDLEMELAQAMQVPVHLIDLVTDELTSIWDFSRTSALIQEGYRQTRLALASGGIPRKLSRRGWPWPFRKWGVG